MPNLNDNLTLKPNKEGIKFTTDRDLELENVVGNLMIAQYQVDKLRNRLSEQIRFIGYGYFGSEKTSAHTFKNNGKWYKLSIKLEETS